MLEYLDDQFNWDDPGAASVHDELPLWSAPFGMMLLEHIPVRPRMTVLDIGFGTGFPLLELAQRLGASSVVYGIDPWKAAFERVKEKMKRLDITNVKLVEGDASAMSFPDNTFHLIVSNTGINNFENVEKVFSECYRTAKPGGRIALTTNPRGHMTEFYNVLKDTMSQLNLEPLFDKLETHIAHRLSIDTVSRLLESAGFKIARTHRQSFVLRFADGSAFLNHSFIRHGFLDAWKALFPAEKLKQVFTRLETNLNRLAETEKEFKVTIPTAYIEGVKPTEQGAI
jgi:ubiquinone/menaquinone biosynthesis C-methylase UbiE